MKVRFRTLSPLAHGAFGESSGNAVLCRRLAVVGAPGMPRVPVVSGNALRGVMRRLLMRDMFERAGLSRETLAGPAWDRMYAAFANGGHLEAAEKSIDPAAIRKVREGFPPLSVFGAALYSWILTGHMSVGYLWPVCRETIEGRLVEGDAGLAPEAESLVEEVSLVRHIEREEQDPTVSGVTPMPVTVEAISAGAELVGEIIFAPHATPVERGAVVAALQMVTALGGKSGSGHGRVELVGHDGDPEWVQAYTQWRDSANIKEAIMEIAAGMSTGKKK